MNLVVLPLVLSRLFNRLIFNFVFFMNNKGFRIPFIYKIMPLIMVLIGLMIGVWLIVFEKNITILSMMGLHNSSLRLIMYISRKLIVYLKREALEISYYGGPFFSYFVRGISGKNGYFIKIILFMFIILG